MIRCNKIEKTIRLSQKLVDRLDLNNIDQGFVTKTTKLNHWNSGGFQPKGNSNTNSVKYEKSYIDIFIDRYSLIQMRCKWVRRESVEYYRFLSLFKKYYNKWYISEEDKVKWSNFSKRTKNCILACIVLASGTNFR